MIPRWCSPRLSFFALAMLVAVLSAAHGAGVVRSDDAFLHLAAGRAIVERGALPPQDLFLNSGEPAPWVLHSWLAEIIFYGAMKMGGIPLLVGLRVALAATAMVLLLLLLRRLGSPHWLAALICALAFLAPGVRSVLMRPLQFSHLLLVIFLLILYQVRAGRWSSRILWLLPALMVPWANLHAGHIVGVALVFLLPLALIIDHVLKRRTQATIPLARATYPALATLAASLINPYGTTIWGYALGFAGSGDYQGQVWEWVGTSPSREPLLFAFLAAAWLVTLLRLRRASTLHLLLVLLLTIMPLLAGRFLYHGAVGAALALGEGLPALLGRLKKLAVVRFVPLVGSVGAMAILVTLIAVAVTRHQGSRFDVDKKLLPVDAVDFMNRLRLSAKILNHREWGGFLIWHRPKQKVFIDGRVAVSAGQVIQDYVAVAEARAGFGNVLNRLRIDLVLASHEVLRPSPDFPFQPIAKDPHWALIYFDDTALIYLRALKRFRSVLQRHAYQGLIPSSTRNPFRPGASPALLERECRRAISITPSERATSYLGLLLMKRNAMEEAERYLKMASELNPRSARALNNLGVVVMHRGDKQRARTIFQRVLKMDPQHQQARRNLDRLK